MKNLKNFRWRLNFQIIFFEPKGFFFLATIFGSQCLCEIKKNSRLKIQMYPHSLH